MTRPAELVHAEATRHVVAGTQLLDSALAHRATADFVVILVHPLLEFLAHSLSAAHTFRVPGLPTVKANLSTTSWAVKLLDLIVFSAHVSFATSLRAPAY